VFSDQRTSAPAPSCAKRRCASASTGSEDAAIACRSMACSSAAGRTPASASNSSDQAQIISGFGFASA
jgi:hypothetical protein